MNPIQFSTDDYMKALQSYRTSNDVGNSGAGLSGMGSTNPLGSIGGALKPLELGWNMPTAQLGLQGIGALGSLWSAFQANSAAQKQFGLQRDMANANLNNQISSYNTSLENKARDASMMRGDTGSAVSSYVNDYLQRHALRADGQVRNGATPAAL
jgi:hypothetical protein